MSPTNMAIAATTSIYPITQPTIVAQFARRGAGSPSLSSHDVWCLTSKGAARTTSSPGNSSQFCLIFQLFIVRHPSKPWALVAGPVMAVPRTVAIGWSLLIVLAVRFFVEPLRRFSARFGGVAEWLKAHAWKACVRGTVPWVRIPLPPPYPCLGPSRHIH